MALSTILPDDSRLRGKTFGTVFPVHGTAVTGTGWHVCIRKKDIGGSTIVSLFQQYISASRFEGNMDLTHQEALRILQRESDRLGLTRNKCRVLDNERIAMDVGDGLEMIFSCTQLDKLVPHLWWVDSNSYVIGCVDGKSVKCHRFITGAAEPDIVDHKSGNKLDNTDDNLHLTTSKGNAENRQMSSRNRSGVMGVGVSYNSDGTVQKYFSHWRENGKHKVKWFYVGVKRTAEQALSEAREYRHLMEEKVGIESRRRTMNTVKEAAISQPERIGRKKRRREEKTVSSSDAGEEDDLPDPPPPPPKRARVEPEPNAAPSSGAEGPRQRTLTEMFGGGHQ